MVAVRTGVAAPSEGGWLAVALRSISPVALRAIPAVALLVRVAPVWVSGCSG